MGGSHVTITHDALNFTVQSPSPMDIRPGPPTPSPAPRHELLVTSGCDHWGPVQIYSLGYPTPATSGGGHWNWSMYGFQTGGTYPTGTLFCTFTVHFIRNEELFHCCISTCGKPIFKNINEWRISLQWLVTVYARWDLTHVRWDWCIWDSYETLIL